MRRNPPFVFSFERKVGPGMKGLVLADDSCIAWKVNAESGSPHHEDIKEEQDLEGRTKFDLSMRRDRGISWLGIDGGLSIDQRVPDVLRYFSGYQQADIIELNMWLNGFDLDLRTGAEVMTVRDFEAWRRSEPRPEMTNDDAKDEKRQAKWVRSFDKAVKAASARSAKGYARDIREFHESDNPPDRIIFGDWNPDHNYDPEWDYHVMFAPQDACKTVESLRDEIVHLILPGVELHGVMIVFAKGLGGVLGKHVDGTGDHPVVVLDVPYIKKLAKRNRVSLRDAFYGTIMHELAHAVVETRGLELRPSMEEGFAEEFARAWIEDGLLMRPEDWK